MGGSLETEGRRRDAWAKALDAGPVDRVLPPPPPRDRPRGVAGALGRHGVTVAPWQLLLAGVLTVALVVALGVWVFNGDDDSDPAVALPSTAAQSAAASASAAAQKSAEAAAAASQSAAAAAASKAAAQKTKLAALPGQLNAILGGTGDTWSVATYNLTTKSELSLGSPDGMYTGSTIKVTVLENLLRTQGGVANLTDGERQLATAMITQSDNDAANSLYNAGGGYDALVQTVSMLGLTHTRIEGGGYFGVSTTSAADQIKVLDQLVTPTFLTAAAADVAYVNNLMANVVPDQRWGTPTMADPGTVTENKNGWLDNDSDNGKWLVNSLGIIVIGGQKYLVAAYSQHHPDFDTGVARLNQAVAAVAATLR